MISWIRISKALNSSYKATSCGTKPLFTEVNGQFPWQELEQQPVYSKLSYIPVGNLFTQWQREKRFNDIKLTFSYEEICKVLPS